MLAREGAALTAVVLSSETPDATAKFYAERLGIATPEPAAPAAVESEPASTAAEQPAAEGEGSKPQEQATNPDDPPAVDADGKPSKVHKRFSELTTRAKQAEEALAAERQARALAEQHATELRNKYEPPKTEPDPKPTRAQFVNDDEFASALEEWTTDKVQRDLAEKDRKTKAHEAWAERETAFKAENPDYDAAIAAGSTLKIPNGVIDAIAGSEFGPDIAYHLAKNPDAVAKLSGMDLTEGLRYIGKLEGKFEAGKTASKPAPTAGKPAPAAAAESKPAPAPITPIRASTAVASDSPVDANGVFHGTAAQWRALREAGKIK